MTQLDYFTCKTIEERLVTIEDDVRVGKYTDCQLLLVDDPANTRLYRAIQELMQIFKRKQPDNPILSGTFYFKVDENES